MSKVPERPSLHTVLSFFEDQVPEDTKPWLESGYISKKLTRKTFFEAAYWAILVANMNVDTAQKWVDNAKASGFPFSWRELGDWNDDDGKFDGWCKRMAKTLADPKEDLHPDFKKRWWGIWDIGWRLAQFESGAAFRKHYFNGKKRGSELTDDDVLRLKEIKRDERALFQIGETNIYYILKMLGGDFLKPDIWIKAFAAWYGCKSVGQLASTLRSEGIRCGKFDTFFFEYCRWHVGGPGDLPRHFNQLFG